MKTKNTKREDKGEEKRRIMKEGEREMKFVKARKRKNAKLGRIK